MNPANSLIKQRGVKINRRDGNQVVQSFIVSFWLI